MITNTVHLSDKTKSEQIDLVEWYFEQGWTDGLPVVPPTPEKVEAMVAALGGQPEEVEARVPPRWGNLTREVLAINMVMAGCKPEYAPVVRAAMLAMCDPHFNLNGIQATTHMAAPLLVVNGPIRSEIGLNAGANVFGSGNRANATIGRAIRLVLLNVGGAWPGELDKSTLGHPGKYTFCIAENEEASPWEPFHVQHGYHKDESTVSIFRGWVFVNSAGTASKRTIGEEMCLNLSFIPPTNASATIVMDPGIAKMLKENDGFEAKQEYSRWLSQNIKMPAERYWGFDHVDWLVTPRAIQGIEPYATFQKARPDELITPYHDPERINLVVVGGDTNPLWKYSEYSYQGSESIDRWRLIPTGMVCEDGKCGVPDPPVEYDE